MSHNYEFALSHVNEGWIANVGDDDGLLPNSLGRIVAIAEENNCLALSAATCTYNWPSRKAATESLLTVPMRTGYDIVDAKLALRRIMDWNVHSLRLPQFYTGGLLHASVLNKIKSINGTFFKSQIPDIYSGFAACSVIDKYVFSRGPFSIAGASNHSTGAALFAIRNTAFLQEDNIPWTTDIPLPKGGTLAFSMPAIAGECYLKSAYLHNNFLKLGPADYFALIMNQSDFGIDQFDDAWQRAYCDMHHLILEDLRALASRTPLRRQISTKRAIAENYFERYRVDNQFGLALNDVFEATISADTILRLRPNRSRSWFRTLKRKSHGGL